MRRGIGALADSIEGEAFRGISQIMPAAFIEDAVTIAAALIFVVSAR